MQKVSRDSAPHRQDAGPVVDLRDELDGYTASFTSLLEDIDATPLMKGLPDDRCPCPHWGYVFNGKMTARYADRDEVFEVGEAFYIPPGHVPIARSESPSTGVDNCVQGAVCTAGSFGLPDWVNRFAQLLFTVVIAHVAVE